MTAKKLGIITLLFPLAAGGASLFGAHARASANSAPAYWEGADSSGALVEGDDCPIAVENELLTIEIPELPKAGYTGETFSDYGASVTARYTFRNPEEKDYTATLLFPFGRTPAYAPFDYNFYGDTARYLVKEEGAPVAVRSRHSWCGETYGTFNVESGINRLAGSSSQFFKEDTPVHAHVFRVTAPKGNAEGHKRWVTLAISFKANASRTRVAASRYTGKSVEAGLGVILYSYLPKADTPVELTVYAFGDDVAFKEQAVYTNRSAKEVAEGFSAELAETTSGEYGAFVAERYRGEESGFTEEDWYNGFTEALEGSVDSAGIMLGEVPDEIDERDFMRWYEYDLRFPAGETVVNEVSAPIYPDIRGGSVMQYDYTYLLSPARKWASFGALTVTIDTPYYLTESSLTFEETETGYYFSWDEGLPLGELTFTLTEEEPSAGKPFIRYPNRENTVILIVIAAIVVALSGGCIAGFFIVGRKKRVEASRGDTEEGKVDLPPEDGKK